MKRFVRITTLLAAFGVVFVLASSHAQAAGKDPNTPKKIPVGCPGSTTVDDKGNKIQHDTNVDCPNGGRLNEYGTFVPAKSSCGTPGIPPNLCDGDHDIQDWANFISNWLVGLISIVAVLMIVIAGVQMVTSAGNPDALKAAKGRLTNAVIGLVALVSMKLILNWIGVL